MTVKELIEALKKFDENKPALLFVYDEDGCAVELEEIEDVFDPNGNGSPVMF